MLAQRAGYLVYIVWAWQLVQNQATPLIATVSILGSLLELRRKSWPISCHAPPHASWRSPEPSMPGRHTHSLLHARATASRAGVLHGGTTCTVSLVCMMRGPAAGLGETARVICAMSCFKSRLPRGVRLCTCGRPRYTSFLCGSFHDELYGLQGWI